MKQQTQKHKSSVHGDSYRALDATNNFAFLVSPVIKLTHEGLILQSGTISNRIRFCFFFFQLKKTTRRVGSKGCASVPLFTPRLSKY